VAGSSSANRTEDEQQAYSSEPTHAGRAEESDLWMQRSRIVLMPIAAPSILGLYGFFAATVMVGTNLAGWWGDERSALAVFPFAFVVGGIAQFLAGMWAYRARDALATAIHGVWGSFWIAYGIFYLLVATHVLPSTPLNQPDMAFGMWFVGLASITGIGALAAATDSAGLLAVLGPLAGGSGVFAAGLWTGTVGLDRIAGWLFVVSAAAAWYVASAMMLAATTGRTVLPLGKYSSAANIPGRRPMSPIQYAEGEPGVRLGQ